MIIRIVWKRVSYVVGSTSINNIGSKMLTKMRGDNVDIIDGWDYRVKIRIQRCRRSNMVTGKVLLKKINDLSALVVCRAWRRSVGSGLNRGRMHRRRFGPLLKPVGIAMLSKTMINDMVVMTIISTHTGRRWRLTTTIWRIVATPAFRTEVKRTTSITLMRLDLKG